MSAKSFLIILAVTFAGTGALVLAEVYFPTSASMVTAFVVGFFVAAVSAIRAQIDVGRF